VQQIVELFLVLFFSFFLLLMVTFVRIFQTSAMYSIPVLRLAMLRHEPPAQLVDLCRVIAAP